MTRRWTPMETSLISRKIAVCSTVFNLFIQLNVIQVTNKSSDFCACIFERIMVKHWCFDRCFPEVSSEKPDGFNYVNGWSDQFGYAKRWEMIFQNLNLKTQETTKTWKWQQHKKMHPSWWSLITFGDSFLTHVPQLGGHVFSNDPMIEKWKLSIHGWKLVPTALTLKDTSFFQTWNPYVKL